MRLCVSKSFSIGTVRWHESSIIRKCACFGSFLRSLEKYDYAHDYDYAMICINATNTERSNRDAQEVLLQARNNDIYHEIVNRAFADHSAGLSRKESTG